MLKLIFKLIKLKLKLRKKKSQCPKHDQATGSATSPSDWVNLPDDILDEIIKIIDHVDLPSFAAVCKSWRSMYVNHFSGLPRNVPLGVPILLLNASKSDSNSCRFVRMNGELANDEIFLPETTNKWVCGSSWGWLVLADTNGKDMSLLNPLTRRVIQLPSILETSTIRLNGFGEPDVPRNGYCYILKAILSTNPTISKHDCIVMAIVGEMMKLAYCRIGDKKWTNVEHDLPGLCEVICHQEIFYATNTRGVLMSCDIRDQNSTKIFALGLYMFFHCEISKKYLVMVSEHLLLVSRIGRNTFKVYSLNKLESSFVQEPMSFSLPVSNDVEVTHKWVQIDSIGDRLLFVGHNATFSLPAQMYNGSKNCIYFTDHRDDPYIGVFNIAKKYTCLYNGNAQDKLFPSFWMIPSPW